LAQQVLVGGRPRHISVHYRFLDYMVDTLLYRNNSGGYSLELGEVLPIAEPMIDGNVRYGYDENELIYYMMDLFGPVEGYEPQEEEL
jgi:hypothetical protein